MSTDVAPRNDVTLTIDGVEVSVPKGTLIIRAAESIGIAIPRFCDHPLLDRVGACRQCMVEIPDAGNGRGFPKPQAACSVEVAQGMQVKTQLTSAAAEKAQAGMLEFLLINHPLDCPVCDKGGECPLQNQALTNGRGESRYDGVKRTFPKPVSISAEVLLDRERCVLCARCTRFSEQISGDPFIALVERGALQQIGSYVDHPYNSNFSGNVIQICPVGALTSSAYRFRARPFDLVSTTTTCEHCASGCELRVDSRHYDVMRRLAGNDPQVNEEWNCDKGRFAFRGFDGDDRITTPLIRQGERLIPVSWHEALDAAAAGLTAAGRRVGVLTGGRLTNETAYAYSKFARAVLGTNSIDFRSRPHSAEETVFLAHHVAGKAFDPAVSYAALESAKQVVLVCFEPEEESPIVFLRLRKAWRKRKLQVVSVAPMLTRGSTKLGARWIPAAPGDEAAVLAGLAREGVTVDAGTIILVGERAAVAPGALSALLDLADSSGARLAWVPRRAGEVGAVEAGCLPGVLPGGRLVSDPAARVDLLAAWGVATLPADEGLDADGMIAAAASGDLRGLVIAGVQPEDMADPIGALKALEGAGFVVSLEARRSDVTARADVVLPVALLEEQSGSFLNWEHRHRPVATVITHNVTPMTEVRVLAALADALGKPLGVRSPLDAAREIAELGPWQGARAQRPDVAWAPSADGGVRLATWRTLVDDSAAADNEPDLRATAAPAVAAMSAATAASHELDGAGRVTVSGPAGSITLPVSIVEGMCDDVVWLPTNSGVSLYQALGARPGDQVTLAAGSVLEEERGAA